MEPAHQEEQMELMTLDQLYARFRLMRFRTQYSRPALLAIADLMQTSAKKNFRAEGRPERWVPVTPATKAYKLKHGWNLILTRTHDLQDHIVTDATDDQAIVGNNLAYARIHQLGGVIQRPSRTYTVRHRTDAKGNLLTQASKGRSFRNAEHLLIFAKGSHKNVLQRAFIGKAYSITMPARPYLVFQPGEIDKYVEILERYWFTGEIKR